MTRERLFTITDEKPDVLDDAYREVVLERGAEVVDIAYNKGAWRAKWDYKTLRTMLATYGYEATKELALYLKERQKQWEQRI